MRGEIDHKNLEQQRDDIGGNDNDQNINNVTITNGSLNEIEKTNDDNETEAIKIIYDLIGEKTLI